MTPVEAAAKLAALLREAADLLLVLATEQPAAAEADAVTHAGDPWLLSRMSAEAFRRACRSAAIPSHAGPRGRLQARRVDVLTLLERRPAPRPPRAPSAPAPHAAPLSDEEALAHLAAPRRTPAKR